MKIRYTVLACVIVAIACYKVGFNQGVNAALPDEIALAKVAAQNNAIIQTEEDLKRELKIINSAKEEIHGIRVDLVELEKLNTQQ